MSIDPEIEIAINNMSANLINHFKIELSKQEGLHKEGMKIDGPTLVLTIIMNCGMNTIEAMFHSFMSAMPEDRTDIAVIKEAVSICTRKLERRLFQIIDKKINYSH